VLLLFWLPIIYFAFDSEEGDFFRKCIFKIALMHVLVPPLIFAFQSTRSLWIVLISALAIGLPRLLWSLSTTPAIVSFLQAFGSVPRISGLTDISDSRSRAAIILLQLTSESIWIYSSILMSFVCNALVAHCGFDWVFVGAMSGLFVGVYESVGSHGDFVNWVMYFASSLCFAVFSGILTGTLFALTWAKILGPGFFFAIAIVPWTSLLLALMLRYLVGFWGTIIVPIVFAGFVAAALVPMYRVREE